MLHALRRYCAPTAAFLLLGVTLVGCGGSGGSGAGGLAIYLSDAPPAGVQQVNIKFDSVDANVNGTWVKVGPLTATTVNLMDAQQVAILLGKNTNLPVGHYTQLRLLYPEASMVVAGNPQPIPLVIPSGDQTGFKVNIDADVVADVVSGVLLDFNLNKSIVSQGNGVYKLQPVIKATLMAASGSISGTVAGSATNPLPSTLPDPNAIVRAVYESGTSYPPTTVVNEASIGTGGTFKLWALLPGTYTVNVYLDGGTTPIATKTGVVVTAPDNTDVGTITLP